MMQSSTTNEELQEEGPLNPLLEKFLTIRITRGVLLTNLGSTNP
jgi:hypothetical protein